MIAAGEVVSGMIARSPTLTTDTLREEDDFGHWLRRGGGLAAGRGAAPAIQSGWLLFPMIFRISRPRTMRRATAL